VKIAKLDIVTCSDVIDQLKSIFTRHGIPETVVSDNCPQYAAQEFVKFAENQGFTHVISSQREVQTIKNLLKKSADPYNALLSYRAIPVECGYSPSDLLMGRQVPTKILVVPSILELHWVDSK